MCGIAGIWLRGGGAVDSGQLLAMSETLSRRGPDDSGICVDGNFGMAHRRLSVIDVSIAGHQPMTTPDGRYTLVFNGEIYNYKELASEYLADVNFVSASDTEVLLHLLAQRGMAALGLIKGMFAFAWWDNQAQELTLVRDPFGKKPLYYQVRNNTVCFGSEAKTLLCVSGTERDIDPSAITAYFLAEYAATPHSGWQDMKQVPMGAYVRLTRSTSQVVKYWQPCFSPKHRDSEYDLAYRLDELLAQAVRRRLIADVPVGLFLSGGLDSTTVGWYMRQLTTKPVHSFSVSFDVSDFDESSYAKQAATHLGLLHHNIPFGMPEFTRGLQQIIPYMDVPLADASLLPTALVAAKARELVTVALDGDGSDELLGGYGTFQAAELAERLPKNHLLVSVLEHLAQLIPTRLGDFTWDFRVKAFVRGLAYELPHRNAVWLGSFTDHELRRLLQPNLHQYIQHIFTAVDDVSSHFTPAHTKLDRISWLTSEGYLHNDILVKLDRATMYSSLEARTPFLDVDLAEFVMRLPDHLKRDKYLLKKIMRGRIPGVIIDRQKKGFGIPLGAWLKGPLYSWANEVLAPEKLQAQGIVDGQYVRGLLGEHRAGKHDHRKKLWTLLAFQLWFDHWGAVESQPYHAADY